MAKTPVYYVYARPESSKLVPVYGEGPWWKVAAFRAVDSALSVVWGTLDAIRDRLIEDLLAGYRRNHPEEVARG